MQPSIRTVATAALLSASLVSATTPVPKLSSTKSVEIVSNATTNWPWLEFVTTNVQPPYLEINATGEPLEPGLLFYTPTSGEVAAYISRTGPIISTDDGELVWAGPVDSDASNFKVQELFGEPVITYWEGTGAAASGLLAGHGYGQVNILNSSYDTIHTICPQLNLTLPSGETSGCDADVHESYITPYDTILVTAYNITGADLSSIGGPADGYVYDTLLVEIDIRTQDILFIWSPLAHVPVNASHYPLGSAGSTTSNPYDFFHANAIQSWEGGYLFNSRHTWTTYYIDRSGNIVWEINGEDGGDFGTLPVGGSFHWQHNAVIRRTASDQISMSWFANNNDLAGQTNITTGVQLLLSYPPDKTAPITLLSNVSDLAHPVYSLAEGSHIVFANGDHFMGYGYEPNLKYFSGSAPDGENLLWSARFAYTNDASSYRAFKQEWHAVPSTIPSLVVKKLNTTVPAGNFLTSNLRGYVSWNGATDVSYYNVYSGSSNETLELVGIASKEGFETQFYLPSDGSVWQVGALTAAHDGTGLTEVKSDIVALF